MSKKSILVAASLTEGRDAAFERGLALARASGAELYVVHAVPVGRPFSVGVLSRNAELRARAEQAGVVVQTVEQHGDPAEIIELHANARRVDLVVMGTEPNASWRWLRPPSIAERVLRRTARPVLLVSADDDAGAGFRNALVALDLTSGSNKLVDEAIHVASTESPRLTMVHVARGIEAATAVRSPGRWKVPEYRTHVLEDARRQLDSLGRDVSTGVDASVKVLTGPTAEAIVDAADAIKADLVVVGRSDRFRPFGSTALRLLRRNTGALLVIPLDGAVHTRSAHEHQTAAAAGA